MNKGIQAILNMYKREGYDLDSILNDIEHGYLTENVTRDGRTVYWYVYGDEELCVDNNGIELSKDEIEEQLI